MLTLKLLALGVLILWISSQQGEVLCYFSLPLHERPTSPGTHLFFIQMWGKYFPLPIPLNVTFEIANASLELAGCLAKYFVGLMMMSSCFLIFPTSSIGIVLFGGRKGLQYNLCSSRKLDCRCCSFRDQRCLGDVAAYCLSSCWLARASQRALLPSLEVQCSVSYINRLHELHLFFAFFCSLKQPPRKGWQVCPDVARQCRSGSLWNLRFLQHLHGCCLLHASAFQ